MPDIIHLLPDSVANQIAAGEVIQRPASVIKELVENAVDAGADDIVVIIKDAGKTLIQVTDNGKGMSPTDARMSFERHATSKINVADDLLRLKTKGFRGEALASIAAIAHVELKTKPENESIGTHLIIEGSEVKKQEPTACASGTSFFVKNLFFNVPVRRNFLKSDAVETSHIVEEFQRIALTHADIKFTFLNNGNEVFKLEKSNLRQRIVNMFGKSLNDKLVPLEEDTDYLKVQGFISKPEFARKTRGEQYFFVNNRYIKSAYLHHALIKAYENLLPAEMYPSYFIYLTLPSQAIDINIHPTKTEIKFEDDKTIYAILRSTVKRSLGMYNIAPTIDFETEPSVEIPPLNPGAVVKPPSITLKPGYNPFGETYKSKDLSQYNNWDQWQKIEKEEPSSRNLDLSTKTGQETTHEEIPNAENQVVLFTGVNTEPEKGLFYQIHKRYIISQIKTGFIILDQNNAHERVLYEKYRKQLAHRKSYSQKLLFPELLKLTPAETDLIQSVIPDLHFLGFEIEAMGKYSFSVNGIPPEIKESDTQNSIEKLLEELKMQGDWKSGIQDFLAKALAKNTAVKSGESMGETEMNQLINDLFNCEQPYYSPSGKPTLITFTLEDMAKRFKK